MIHSNKFTRLLTMLLILGLPISMSAQDSQPATSAPAVTPTPPVPRMKTNAVKVETPVSFPGIETRAYRDLESAPLLMHIAKPEDWKNTDKRPALVWFFGGGFVSGTPKSSVGWAKFAAMHGMVGFAPDYRTVSRFDTTPQECLADGRYSLRYIQDHAEELGIDPTKIVVGGGSAGGGVALWTAINTNPPGSPESERPLFKPAALLLIAPVSDTSFATGYGADRIGYYADQISAYHYFDPKMPPMLLYHGDADASVPYENSVALNKKMLDTGNQITFYTAPGGSHKFAYELPEWKERIRPEMMQFIKDQGILESVPE